MESFNYACIILEKHRHGGNENRSNCETNGDLGYRTGLIFARYNISRIATISYRIIIIERHVASDVCQGVAA